MKYKIKNWDKFQHFKDRRPPWIKLYRDILDDPQWFALSGDDAKALICLWLLASENEGYLPDITMISFRLRINEKKASEHIFKLKHWLNCDDIGMISGRYHDDTPETETETETETEAGVEVFKIPDWIPDRLWSEFMEVRKKLKAADTMRAKNLLVSELERLRKLGHDPIAVLEKSIRSSWKDVYPIKDGEKKTAKSSTSVKRNMQVV
jgi:hypothetical protein